MPSERLLAPHGASNFSNLYRQSVDTLFTAYPAYQRAEYSVASKILDAFWKSHPVGTKEWESANGEGERAARTRGVRRSPLLRCSAHADRVRRLEIESSNGAC